MGTVYADGKAGVNSDPAQPTALALGLSPPPALRIAESPKRQQTIAHFWQGQQSHALRKYASFH
jgi:hypothetical protein